MAYRFQIDSRLRVDRETVVKLTERGVFNELRKACTHDNPAYATWLKYKKGKPPPKYVTSARLDSDGRWSFPRGRVSQISDIVGGNVELVDSRVVIPAPIVQWHGDPARAYQRRLIDAGMRARRNREWTAGVWRSPPASGKTSAALELVAGLGLRALIVAPTKGVFEQWVERARAYLHTEPGIVQGKRQTIGELVTVAMQKTLWNCGHELANEFGAVIVDECQLAGARTYQEVFDRSPALFRLGVSGDERRADGLELLIYDQLGDVTGEVGLQEVIDAGGAVPVDVVIVPTEFEADWYKKLKPERKFLKRNDLIEKMSEDTVRNELAVKVARQCAAQGERVIVLTQRRDHAQRIDSLACLHGPSVLLIGSDKEFADNRKAFAAADAIFAVGTYKAIGVGFESHRELACGVMASPVASNPKGEMQFKQFLGRYARSARGKERGTVFYLLDVRVFGKRPAQLIKSWCGNNRVSVLVGEERVPVSDWLKSKKARDDEGDEEENGTGNLDFFGFTR